MNWFKNGGYTGGKLTTGLLRRGESVLPEGVRAGTVHPARYYFEDKELAERWKLSHPEARVHYWLDDVDCVGWVEL